MSVMGLMPHLPHDVSLADDTVSKLAPGLVIPGRLLAELVPAHTALSIVLVELDWNKRIKV